MPLKELAYRLLKTPYELVFQEQMTDEVQKLFVGTSYVAIGTLFGALLSFIFGILGARILGPDNFGNFALITALSVILGIFMVLTIASTIKYASGARDDSMRAGIISTSFIQTAFLTCAVTVIYVFFSPQLSQLFGISSALFLFSIAYAVSSSFFTITMNWLRILFKMRAYALLNAVQSSIVLAAFLVFVSYDLKTWESAAYSTYISYVVIGLILVVYLRTYLKLQFDRFWAKKITSYSLFAAPGVTAAAFMGVDRLLINMFGTTAAVGVYAAYFLPSITVALMFFSIFNAAFFPYASKSSDRQTIFNKINSAVPYLAALLLPLIIILELLVFTFYGSRYPFSWEIAVFFAIAATVFVVYQFYFSLTASVGASGAKLTTVSSILALAVLIGLDVILIPLIGVSGAAITLIFAYLIPAVFLFSKWRVLTVG